MQRVNSSQEQSLLWQQAQTSSSQSSYAQANVLVASTSPTHNSNGPYIHKQVQKTDKKEQGQLLTLSSFDFMIDKYA